MGIDFRDGKYVRRVNIGKRTVKEGEAVAIWNRYGEHRKVIGPKLVYLFYSTIRFLDHYVASDDQYLVLERNNGALEYVRGPCDVWHDPVEHRSVTVMKALHVMTSNDCLVILDANTNKVRELLKGPAMYFPKTSEKVHIFRWTKSSGNDERATESFSTLTLNSARFEASVTLADRAQARFLITYSIQDLEFLVENVDDPHQQMLNGLQSDLIRMEAIALQKASSGSNINHLFPQLISACGRMKLFLESVTILGMTLSPEAQRAAEAKRKLQTELQTTEESARMKVTVANLELDGERERAEKRNQFERQELERRLALQKQRFEAERMLKMQSMEDTSTFLTKLKEAGVDVTQFTVELVKSARTGEADSNSSLDQLARSLIRGFAEFREATNHGD